RRGRRERREEEKRGFVEGFLGDRICCFFFTAEGAENAERRKREVLLRVFWVTGYADKMLINVE
ncbi:hypothetical protein QUA97_17700, partial [Microcoleus sp. CZ3-B2]|uniref:hypothetical protein n=1 Tax=Microcoleus sp. CZ3-B2 TaxID=2818731 RepID=UPI002FD3E83F